MEIPRGQGKAEITDKARSSYDNSLVQALLERSNRNVHYPGFAPERAVQPNGKK
jgi:hypothetical protein